MESKLLSKKTSMTKHKKEQTYQQLYKTYYPNNWSLVKSL